MVLPPPSAYTDTDIAKTFGSLGHWWHYVLDPVGADRAASGSPSALDLAGEAAALLDALTGSPTTGEPLERIEAGADLALKAVGALLPTDRARVERALTEATGQLHRAGRALHLAGAAPTSGSGTVVQVNRSGGGVPKLPVERARVGANGIEGDGHRFRQHHGRPWQALCLWSAEVIDAFAAAGHPLAYGSAGENVTLRGIDWTQMRAGIVLRIGTVVCETTTWAWPCNANAPWFIDGDFEAMHHERGPVSRIYAFVLEPGEVAPGDEVVVEPADVQPS